MEILNMEGKQNAGALLNGTENNITAIELNGLKKSFGSKEVLKNINLEVTKGENLVILGKSGSGKSVTIKCIVKMIEPDAGTVKVFGEDVSTLDEMQLKLLRQKIGFLFQSGALYDSMTVEENLSFTLKRVLNIKDKQLISDKISEVLEGVGLPDALHKMPADLSGGMRKRIALARTLIVDPEIILYDEPTTGLDAITSREISELILHMQKKYNTTSIIITHDMKCAEIVSDRIVIMSDGEYIAMGTYEALKNSSDEMITAFFK
jgi:phospholipid/cholesterol/gamma-HCH transport system ATP-binding protein